MLTILVLLMVLRVLTVLTLLAMLTQLDGFGCADTQSCDLTNHTPLSEVMSVLLQMSLDMKPRSTNSLSEVSMCTM